MVSATFPSCLQFNSKAPRSGGALLEPHQRQEVAVAALSGLDPLSRIADSWEVSRKFVYQQKARAEEALREAFQPEPFPESFRGWLPVNRAWIERTVLSAALHCHGSIRGICEHLYALTGLSLAEGSVFNILERAMAQAERLNRSEDLGNIKQGAHDEIFSQGVPVLVGVEPDSSYLYLMEPASGRDEVCWWAALAQKREQQHLELKLSISDAAGGLRAGVRTAFEGIEVRGDILHAQMEVSELVGALETNAYRALQELQQQELRMERAKRRCRGNTCSTALQRRRERAEQAVQIYDEIHLLAGWLVELLQLVGPSLAERRECYDWVVSEIEQRAAQYHRLTPMVRYLKNQRDELLAFVGQIERGLGEIALAFQLPLGAVEKVYRQLGREARIRRGLPPRQELHPQTSQQDAALQERICAMLQDVLRASSAIENINSILRSYFFLRKSAGPKFLALLQFYLNHRRFRRSRCPERVGKSPWELLTGQSHPDWLELLGYPPVSLLN